MLDMKIDVKGNTFLALIRCDGLAAESVARFSAVDSLSHRSKIPTGHGMASVVTLSESFAIMPI